jgi:hypothetical protein
LRILDIFLCLSGAAVGILFGELLPKSLQIELSKQLVIGTYIPDVVSVAPLVFSIFLSLLFWKMFKITKELIEVVYYTVLYVYINYPDKIKTELRDDVKSFLK